MYSEQNIINKYLNGDCNKLVYSDFNYTHFVANKLYNIEKLIEAEEQHKYIVGFKNIILKNFDDLKYFDLLINIKNLNVNLYDRYTNKQINKHLYNITQYSCLLGPYSNIYLQNADSDINIICDAYMFTNNPRRMFIIEHIPFHLDMHGTLYFEEGLLKTRDSITSASITSASVSKL